MINIYPKKYLSFVMFEGFSQVIVNFDFIQETMTDIKRHPYLDLSLIISDLI